MSAQMDKVLSIYRTLTQIPALSSARIMKNGSSIASHWTERNLERNKTTKIMYTQEINKNFEIISESPFGVDISSELISAVSPSENLKAVIREYADMKDKKKQYLEIWRNRQMTQCIDLNALDIHGDVYNDSEFSSFSWDESENKLIYIAERKLPKSEPFYKRKPLKAKPENEANTPPTKGKEYDFKPEWGEQLVGKHLSSIIICELDTENFTVVDWIPESWCPGQVSWSPDGSSIVGIAWETEPRRLGLIFCSNRPSVIFSMNLEGEYKIISEKGYAVRSPRFSTDGKYLIWLQRNEIKPHNAGHQLVKTAWPLSDNPIVEVVIDKVDDEIIIEGGDLFTGLYKLDLSQRAFSSDGKRVILSSSQRTEMRSFVVDIENGKITDISDKSQPGSTVILDVHQDIILASRSSLKQPGQLIIARLPNAGEESNINWQLLDNNPVDIPKLISSAKIEYMSLEHDNDDSIKKFSAIFFSGDNTNPSPLIVWPHGGPHASFINSYSLEAALFCMLGFSMIQINYRGSTGAGEKSLQYLLGKVGDADVKDCILATDVAIKQFSVDGDRCVLLGRSHGGFLVTHLSGQYPDRFKAVVAGNPVTDISSMINSSDIPDWCSIEAGTDFNEVGPASDTLLLEMRKASPIAHSHNVTAPTLLCLGSKDKRVPFFQGIEFYNKIKANGCKARMLIYKDNHALSNGNVEIDHLINGALWFLEHTE